MNGGRFFFSTNSMFEFISEITELGIPISSIKIFPAYLKPGALNMPSFGT